MKYACKSKIKISFSDLKINSDILRALVDLKYEYPSPIQIECIPYLLDGCDVLGTAQTGSGKTAAFALPLLHVIDEKLSVPQILVLVPTRELAIQVGESFVSFSKYIKGINIITIYGGSRYDLQLSALRKGPQVIVGTPGRILDHLRRGNLNLSNLIGIVLDEADEMLRMGFIEDVESILTKVPPKHQTALFSATMPETIRHIAKRFMHNPKEIQIHCSNTTRPDITQNYWTVYDGIHKNDALIRFLEVENFYAAIVFVRTKKATLEISEVLEKNGYNSAALNGDMNQELREKTLDRLRDGRLDILIATDVAARGLDVDRINLVVNYDIPMDSESYVHRIGRTGRAGRSGRALLFVKNNERRFLRNIERITKLTIQEIKLPTYKTLNACRLAKFSTKIKNQLESSDLEIYRKILLKLQIKEKLELDNLAVALLKMAQGERSLVCIPDPTIEKKLSYIDRKKNFSFNHERKKIKEMDLYRIEVGKNDGVEIRHIVGAIANEGDINSNYIGNIKLFASYSIVELPKGMTGKMLSHFTKMRILNKPIKMRFIGESNDKRSYNRRC